MKIILFALILCSCAHTGPPRQDVECKNVIICPKNSAPMYVKDWGCMCSTEIVEGKH